MWEEMYRLSKVWRIQGVRWENHKIYGFPLLAASESVSFNPFMKKGI